MNKKEKHQESYKDESDQNQVSLDDIESKDPKRARFIKGYLKASMGA